MHPSHSSGTYSWALLALVDRCRAGPGSLAQSRHRPGWSGSPGPGGAPSGGSGKNRYPIGVRKQWQTFRAASAVAACDRLPSRQWPETSKRPLPGDTPARSLAQVRSADWTGTRTVIAGSHRVPGCTPAQRQGSDGGGAGHMTIIREGSLHSPEGDISLHPWGFQLARRASRNCSTRAAALSCEPSSRWAYSRFEVSMSA